MADQKFDIGPFTAANQVVVQSLVGSAATFIGTPANFPIHHTFQPRISGSPANCRYQICGTTKYISENPVFPNDFALLNDEIDALAADGGVIHLNYRAWATIAIKVTALDGGTSPRLVVGYLGVRKA